MPDTYKFAVTLHVTVADHNEHAARRCIEHALMETLPEEWVIPDAIAVDLVEVRQTFGTQPTYERPEQRRDRLGIDWA